MNPSEIREKTDDELTALEGELRMQLVTLRVAQATSRPVNTASFRRVRGDIARIKTIQTQRRNAEASK